MALKVLVVDDHKIVSDGIKMTLQDVDGIVVVGQAYSGAEALKMVPRTLPDVVLLDMNMPGMDGKEALSIIREKHPNVNVVMLSASDDIREIRDCLNRGARAYIVKNVCAMDLVSAVRQAYEGNVYHSSGVLNTEPVDPLKEAGLTEREVEMLKAVARGLSNKAISQELWVTEQTVKFHLNNVYRKLGVPNRTAAASFAHERGLVSSDPAAA